MTIGRAWRRGALIGVATLTLAATAACGGNDDNKTATPTGAVSRAATPTAVVATQPPRPTVGPAPSPVAVDVGNLKLIDEWRAYEVPEYPGAVKGEFQKADGSTIRNAGQIAYGTQDEPEKVLAYYRGALKALGWTETQATAQQIVVKNKEASLLVSSSKNAEGTAILLMLSDAL